MARRLLLILIAIALVLSQAGNFLVIDRPLPSDVGIVLQGDRADFRLNHGIEMVKKGVVRELVVNADNRAPFYGKTYLQLAQEYVRTLPPDLAAHVHPCPLAATSTVEEATDAARCLAPLHPARVLLVTSDYHTRRALSVFRAVLPNYAWSVTASHDPVQFGEHWWKSREWTKTTFMEWQKFLFWYLYERWKVHPIT